MSQLIFSCLIFAGHTALALPHSLPTTTTHAEAFGPGPQYPLPGIDYYEAQDNSSCRFGQPAGPAFNRPHRTKLAFSWGFLLGVIVAVLVLFAVAGSYLVVTIRLGQQRSELVVVPPPQPLGPRMSLSGAPGATHQAPPAYAYHQPQSQESGQNVEPSMITIIGEAGRFVLSPETSPRLRVLQIQEGPAHGMPTLVLVQQLSLNLQNGPATGSGEHRMHDATLQSTEPMANTSSQTGDGAQPANTQPTPVSPARYLSWIPILRAGSAPRPTSPIPAPSRAQTLVQSLTGLSLMERSFVDILGVGLTWIHNPDRELPGPAHDMRWLDNLCANQRDVRFRYLLDNTATRDMIHARMKEMHEHATPETHLVFYFAGHGLENAFELYDPDSAPLDEVVLNQWIVEFRRITRKNVPVYIVFDFCRDKPVEFKPDLAEDIHIIWACSPGQSALDIRLPSRGPDHLPRSCFLIALVLAADDASKNASSSPWKSLTMRMNGLVRVVRGVRCYASRCRPGWYFCQCETCSCGNLCHHDKHPEEQRLFQDISITTLEPEGDPTFATVAQFLASRFPLHIQRASNQVANDRWVMFFNPARIAANGGSIMPRALPRDSTQAISRTTFRHLTVPVM